MSVSIRLNNVLQAVLKSDELIEVQGSTVGECIEDLLAGHPEYRKVLYTANGMLRAMVVYDNRIITGSMMEKPVRDGEEIRLLQIVTGG